MAEPGMQRSFQDRKGLRAVTDVIFNFFVAVT